MIIKWLSIYIIRPTLSVLVPQSKNGEYLGLLKRLEEYGNTVMLYLSGARYDNGASSQRHGPGSEWIGDRKNMNDFDGFWTDDTWQEE